MAKSASKGTLFQLSISSSLTTITQVIGFDGPGMKPAVYDATALDSGVGMEHKPTGYTDGGTVSGTLFFDPVAATHQAMTDLITTPAVASWNITWSDAGTTDWPFSGVLTSFQPSAALTDGLKASWEVTLDGIPTLPT